MRFWKRTFDLLILLICLMAVLTCHAAFADGLSDLQNAVNSGEASYTVSSDLEIPADTEVHAWNMIINIPSDVTLTVSGRLTVRGFKIAETGTLSVGSAARVEFHDDINPPDVTRTVNGSVILTGDASLNTDVASWNFTNFKDHVRAEAGPAGEKPVIHLSIVANSQTANVQGMLEDLNEAVSAASVYGADFTGTLFVEFDLAPSSDMTVPAGIELNIRDLTQNGTGGRLTIPENVRFTVEAGANLNLRGAPMTLNGTLVNNGDLALATNMYGETSSLTFGSGANVQGSGNITNNENGSLIVDNTWANLSNNVWDNWLRNGITERIVYQGDAGFILHRGVSTAGDDLNGLQRAFTDAGNYLSGNDHLHFAIHIPDGTWIDTGETAVMIPDGITVDITGGLHTNAGMTVGNGGFINVSGNGNLHVDRVLTVNGKANLSGWSNVSCDYTAGTGSIILNDNSHMHMHSGDWSKEQASINGGTFQINDSAVIEPIINVNNESSFNSVWTICQGLGEHINGRMRINYPMTVSENLNAASPKAVGFEIRGDHGSNGSLTVNANATFTASFLDLHSANMTVNGKLISTSEVQLQGEDEYPIGVISFAGDACYESTRSGYLLIRDNENPDSLISGLTMTRFNVSRQGDGWKYGDTGILSFATSAGLRDAIAEGRDFTVTQNTLIDADEIGENAVDASDIKITINSGVVLVIRGKLILGDLRAVFNPDDPDDSGRFIISDGGELHATRWLDIDNMTWTILEKNSSADKVTFEEDAGFTLHRGDCAADAETLSFTLGDAERTLSRRAQGHLRFEFGIPEGTIISSPDTPIRIPSGVTLDVKGSLRTTAMLTVEEGAEIIIGKETMGEGAEPATIFYNNQEVQSVFGTVTLWDNAALHTDLITWNSTGIRDRVEVTGQNTVIYSSIGVGPMIQNEFEDTWNAMLNMIPERLEGCNFVRTFSVGFDWQPQEDFTVPAGLQLVVGSIDGTTGLTVPQGVVFAVAEDARLTLQGAKMTVNDGGTLLNSGHIQLERWTTQETNTPASFTLQAGARCRGNGEILVATGTPENTTLNDNANQLTGPENLGNYLKYSCIIDVACNADLILPASLTEIGSEAFANGGFNSVYIPATTTTIESDAFGDRTDLIVFGTFDSRAYTFAQEKGFAFKAVA